MKNKTKLTGTLVLYITVILTITLSLIILFAWGNICYLPINTTGECVIAKSIMNLKFFMPFIIIESIISIIITILYLNDGFKYKITKFKLLCLLNILTQPAIFIIILSTIQ